MDVAVVLQRGLRKPLKEADTWRHLCCGLRLGGSFWLRRRGRPPDHQVPCGLSRDVDTFWYILAVYAAGVVTPLALSLGVSGRLTHAKARLAAFDPRVARMSKHGERS